MKQITTKKVIGIFIFVSMAVSACVNLGGTSVLAAESVEKQASDYCAKIKGPANDPSITALRAACVEGFTAGYKGGNKTATCRSPASGKTVCEDGFDKGKVAKAAASGGVPGSVTPVADPCKDPKSVDPEAGCVKTGKVMLTDDDAKRAGLTPRNGDDIVAKTLNGVYTIVAIVAVIVIVLAGIRIITADGDSSKVAAARQTIIYAVVGLAVVGSAFIITGIVQGIGTK